MSTPIHRTIRDTKRLARVLTVLAKYGLIEALEESGLDSLIAKAPLPRKTRDEAAAATAMPRAVRIRLALEELGPTFIKLGQILSTRPDLVPPEIVEELSKLQHQVPPVEFDAIEKQLEGEFGDLEAVFRSVDPEPLAAASMAQAHRAVLADGTPVVLKVLRPGIEEILDSDMEILSHAARLADKHLRNHGFNPVKVVDEFAKQLRKEVDFTVEARSTDRLEQHFRNEPGVAFPHVFYEASSQRVLALEEVKGRLLSDVDPESLSPEMRRLIVEYGTDAVFEMCLELGFFHADPHPGNIFVHDDGSITFIDCGMTGSVDERTRVQLAQLVQAVVAGNVDGVMRIALDLADGDAALEFERDFRADVSEYVSGLHAAGAALENIRLGPMLEGFFDLLRKWDVTCPSDLVFLIKALATIEGVGKSIDPSFDLVTHVRPRIERLVRRQYGPTAMRRRLIRSLGGFVDIIEEIPADIRNLLSMTRQRDFAITLQHRGLDRLSSTVDRASRTISYALVMAALLITAGLLVSADQNDDHFGVLSIIGFVCLTVVGTVILLLSGWNVWRLRVELKKGRKEQSNRPRR